MIMSYLRIKAISNNLLRRKGRVVHSHKLWNTRVHQYRSINVNCFSNLQEKTVCCSGHCLNNSWLEKLQWIQRPIMHEKLLVGKLNISTHISSPNNLKLSLTDLSKPRHFDFNIKQILCFLLLLLLLLVNFNHLVFYFLYGIFLLL